MEKSWLNTRYLQFNESDLQLAGRLIREGNLVAFPTETVYGLGANALDENAVKRDVPATIRLSCMCGTKVRFST